MLAEDRLKQEFSVFLILQMPSKINNSFKHDKVPNQLEFCISDKSFHA